MYSWDREREGQQGRSQEAEGGLICSNPKGMSSTTLCSGLVDGMKTAPLEKAATPEGDQESLCGNNHKEQFLNLDEYLTNGIDLASTSSPADTELTGRHLGSFSALWYEKPTKNSVKETVACILEELNRSIAPAVVNQERIVNALKENSFPSQEGDYGSKTGGAVDLAMEDDIVSDSAMEAVVKELSEAGTDTENAEPTGKTWPLVHAGAFPLSPVLSTPYTPKATPCKSSSEQPSAKQVPKKGKRGPRRERETEIPTSFIRKIFRHHAWMPVGKGAYKAVEQCVNVYCRQLCDDLEIYRNHAGRETIEPADVELLMMREKLITDKTPLNVLIERHMPLEYRKLLLPVATSGNKVVPAKSWKGCGKAS